MLAQRWVHDLTGFAALAQPDQEAVFGRTKPDSVELEGDAKPPDAHISRVEIHDATGRSGPSSAAAPPTAP